MTKKCCNNCEIIAGIYEILKENDNIVKKIIIKEIISTIILFAILIITICCCILTQKELNGNGTQNEIFENNTTTDEQTENWQKIKENFYIDKISIETQDDFVSGIFKKNMISENEYKNGVKATYKTIWTGAYCNLSQQSELKKMEYPIYKYYDIENNLLEEDNIHEYWQENYSNGHLGITYPEDVEDGELLFNSLCQYYKK